MGNGEGRGGAMAGRCRHVVADSRAAGSHAAWPAMSRTAGT